MSARSAALAWIVALAAAAVGVAGAVVLLDPLPSRRGDVVLAGMTAPAEARYDRAGIPHVRAVLETDAWRALGWIHASDRLFQMEMRRRAAEGRLAEVLGPAALPRDEAARRRGYAATAESAWADASDRERTILEAYAQGVNAYLADQPLPLELRALGIDPEPWSPRDSLAFGALMYDGLSMSAPRERAVLADAAERGAAAAAALADAADGGTTHVPEEVVRALAGATPPRGPAEAPAAAAGSNAWALAGSRSASGKPLLAGDPHLDVERPGTWYAAQLESADGLDVCGLTLPGTPGVFIGHDGRVAWSITMNQGDDADLYLEKIDDARGAWLDGDAWIPLERRTETIRVKGAPDVHLEVEATRHGPIVERLGGDAGIGVALRRSWVGARGGSLGVFLASGRARDGDELLAAWAGYGGPPVNLCWADARGHIGVHVFGAIPERGAGDGRFPAPGWLARYDWTGLVPADRLPGIENPPEGFVASANDDWSAAGRPLPFPGLYASSDRVERARQLAGVLRHASVPDMRTMQADLYSPYAARIVATLRRVRLDDPEARRAAKILASWDATAATRGPSRLFFAFMREAWKGAALPRGRGAAGAWVQWSLLDRMIAGRAGGDLWDDPATPERETREEWIARALTRALAEVEREDGKNPRRWSWGRVHRLTYDHPFASRLPSLLRRKLRFGPVNLPGSWHTLDVAGFPLAGRDYRVVHIPSARIIVDLGAIDDSRIVLPLGQSGQLFDRHAADMLRPWSRVRDVPLPFSTEAVVKATISTVRFLPND